MAVRTAFQAECPVDGLPGLVATSLTGAVPGIAIKRPGQMGQPHAVEGFEVAGLAQSLFRRPPFLAFEVRQPGFGLDLGV